MSFQSFQQWSVDAKISCPFCHACRHAVVSNFCRLTQPRRSGRGRGDVAERKTLALLDAGAAVTLGAPALTPALRALRDQGRLRHIDGHFEPGWVAGNWLIIAATDDVALNAAVAAAGEQHHIFTNVVDDPQRCSFQVPSVINRAPIQIAISSGGTAPVLARRIRERLESLLDHSLGQLASLAAKRRISIRTRLPDLRRRRQFYDWLLDGPVAALLRQARPQAAEQACSRRWHRNTRRCRAVSRW